MIKKHYLKSLYFLSLKLLQRDKFFLNQIKSKDLMIVLNLHQVSPFSNPFWSPLHPDIFEELLIFLKTHFQVVLFKEINEIKTDKPIAVLSFDDGYFDFIEYAMPLLEKHDLRVNMNIIPACIESGEPVWLIKLYDFLNVAPISLINEINLDGFDYRLRDESDESKVLYSLRLSGFLKNRSHTERKNYWNEIEKIMNRLDFKLTRMMNRKETLEVSKTHEIGAHSYSHESMGFEENEFFEEDLQKCLIYFKDKLHLPLEVYAFPNGSFRPEQVEILRKHQIKYKLLVEENYSKKGDDVVSRFSIYGSSPLEARFQALGVNRSETPTLINKFKMILR